MSIEHKTTAQIVINAPRHEGEPTKKARVQMTPDGVWLSVLTPMPPRFGPMGENAYDTDSIELSAGDARALGQWLLDLDQLGDSQK